MRNASVIAILIVLCCGIYVPQTGSFEVRFSDGRPSVYFYWDDIPGRRVRPDQTDSTRALEAARALARSERDKIK